ncbi:Gag-pol polyprotein, related [Eimeria brunetti]|uniref:Gag-pol polyprotein, related n=1 Tax=Eimeria brunetti TaxID=51314 RepID=U6LR03_9EIME|nr:Gag-pol polyprotein, related [Eimeria brunetti]
MHPNFKKRRFGTSSIEYLGYRIAGDGITRSPAKIKAIEVWPEELRNDARVKQFLAASELTKKDASFVWTEKHTAAVALKHTLVNYTTLQTPDAKKPYVLRANTSRYAAGGVSEQDGKPLGFMIPANSKQEMGTMVDTISKMAHFVPTKTPAAGADTLELLADRVMEPLLYPVQSEKGLVKLLAPPNRRPNGEGARDVGAEIELVDEFSPTKTPPLTKIFKQLVDRAASDILPTQAAQKQYADKHRREVEYEVGGCIFCSACFSEYKWIMNLPSPSNSRIEARRQGTLDGTLAVGTNSGIPQMRTIRYDYQLVSDLQR